jgi:hypothetical protein
LPFLLIMCCDLEVADCRMTTPVKLVFAQPLVAGSPSLVRQLMGDGVFHRRPFAQGGPATLGLELGTQLLLERLVLADGQAPALPNPGFGALRTHRTRVTRTGRKLGVGHDPNFRPTCETRGEPDVKTQRS